MTTRARQWRRRRRAAGQQAATSEAEGGSGWSDGGDGGGGGDSGGGGVGGGNGGGSGGGRRRRRAGAASGPTGGAHVDWQGADGRQRPATGRRCDWWRWRPRGLRGGGSREGGLSPQREGAAKERVWPGARGHLGGRNKVPSAEERRRASWTESP